MIFTKCRNIPSLCWCLNAGAAFANNVLLKEASPVGHTFARQDQQRGRNGSQFFHLTP